jgi:hypothetical protein
MDSVGKKQWAAAFGVVKSRGATFVTPMGNRSSLIKTPTSVLAVCQASVTFVIEGFSGALD